MRTSDVIILLSAMGRKYLPSSAFSCFVHRHQLIVALLVNEVARVDQPRKEIMYEIGGPRVVFNHYYNGAKNAPVFAQKAPGVPIFFIFPCFFIPLRTRCEHQT